MLSGAIMVSDRACLSFPQPYPSISAILEHESMWLIVVIVNYHVRELFLLLELMYTHEKKTLLLWKCYLLVFQNFHYQSFHYQGEKMASVEMFFGDG